MKIVDKNEHKSDDGKIYNNYHLEDTCPCCEGIMHFGVLVRNDEKLSHKQIISKAKEEKRNRVNDFVSDFTTNSKSDEKI
jgi:hypothetical protein